MEIEMRTLMADNEMLSHIFLGCIPHEQLIAIRDKHNPDKLDWRNETVTVPVTLTIGGVEVDPKKFFDTWKDQMGDMISRKAQRLVAEKLGSQRMIDMQDKLNGFEQVLKEWESEINWDVKNPLLDED